MSDTELRLLFSGHHDIFTEIQDRMGLSATEVHGQTQTERDGQTDIETRSDTNTPANLITVVAPEVILLNCRRNDANWTSDCTFSLRELLMYGTVLMISQ